MRFGAIAKMDSNFHIEIECDLFEKAEAPSGRQRRIGGFVSTESLDKQGEVLIQKGLDFGPFLRDGFFNDNHLKQTGKAVGYPEIAELRMHKGAPAWYVEGFLLENHPPADEIWSMAKSLERAGWPRKLGYSVEGQILERDPADIRTVRKAVVREVAVTRCPVNDETQLMLLAKSLSAGHGGSGSGSGVAGAAGPLSQESLEGRVAPRPDEEEEDAKKRVKKKMKKSEAVAFLMTRNPFLSETSATRIVEFALRRTAA